MIDWGKVQQLKADIGASNFDEVVALFFEEIENAFARMQSSGVTQTEMHLLKGTTLNLGFREFSKLCQITEHSLTSGQASHSLAEIRASFLQSRTQFLSELQSQLT